MKRRTKRKPKNVKAKEGNSNYSPIKGNSNRGEEIQGENKWVGETQSILTVEELAGLTAKCIAYTEHDPPINGYGYRPRQHIARLLEHTSCGCGIREAMIPAGVTISQSERWQHIFPSWSAAIAVAKQLSEAWWKEMGRRNLYSKVFNQSLYALQMANRHRWANSSVTGKLHTTHTERREVKVDLSGLTGEELESLESLLEKAEGEEEKEVEGESDLIIDS